MRFKVFSSLLVVILLLSGFSIYSATSSGTELVFGSYRVLSGMDTHGKDSIEAYLIIRNVFDTLVRYDSVKGEFYPELATKWEAVDALTWKFTLRQGVTFHDGTPLTSEAVKATVEMIKKRQGPTSPMFADIKRVETPDEFTAVFKLNKPMGYLLSGLSITGIIPPWALEKEDEFLMKPIGTGPFKFKEWIPNRHQILVANENYWDPDAVKLSTVRIVEIPEGAARTTALLNGEIDVTDQIAYADVSTVKRAKGINAVVRPSIAGYRIFINCGINPERNTPNPFASSKVREALWYTIDVDALESMYDFVRRADTIMGRGVIGAAKLPPYKRDLKKAKQLLAEAGYPNGFSCTLKVRHLDPLDAEIAEMIAADLSEVGIQAKIILQPNPVWVADVSPTDNNPFDLSLFYHAAQLPDPYYIMDRMFTQGTKRTGYKNLFFDDLLRKANEQTDPVERIRIYKEAQQVLWGTGPTMFPVELIEYTGIADYVQNYNHNETWPDFRRVSVAK